MCALNLWWSECIQYLRPLCHRIEMRPRIAACSRRLFRRPGSFGERTCSGPVRDVCTATGPTPLRPVGRSGGDLAGTLQQDSRDPLPATASRGQQPRDALRNLFRNLSEDFAAAEVAPPQMVRAEVPAPFRVPALKSRLPATFSTRMATEPGITQRALARGAL
ncbi:hypothetical protein M885DRAFT_503612 [Pelagophyceae sp. CCMP2097]|nr:hypothetical protein M885DRAFT_503612 [Pelagophyceae sp. CCMP2097]